MPVKSEWMWGVSLTQWAFPLYVSFTFGGAVRFLGVHFLCFFVSYESWPTDE